MFLINSLLLAKTNMAVETTNCMYNNTYRDENNNCVCLPGYFNDPEKGINDCYTCKDGCHSMALCVHPGICICAQGLIGDGQKCWFPLPKQYVFDIPEPLETGGYNLTIKVRHPKNHIVYKLYCQIGGEIFESHSFNVTVAYFIIPMSIYGYQNITISYDKMNWSPDVKRIYFQKTYSHQFINESTPFVFALLVVVLIGTCLLHGKGAIFDKEEEIPLPHVTDNAK